MLADFARVAVYGGHLERVNAGEVLMRAFKAARAQALEEAANVCEAIADEYQRTEGRRYPELKSDAEMGASACEAAIRALSNP